MRRTWLSVLAVAMLLGASGMGWAQDSKPLAVVSFSGYDELMADVGMIGKLGGAPEVGKILEGALAGLTGGRGLAGLDKSKPIGAVVYAEDDDFPIIGFVPVTDLKALLAVLAEGLGKAEDAGDGVYELSGGAMPLFVTEKTGWAFISNSKENLAKAPADPLKVLGGLEKKYDLAATVTVKNVPEQVRGMIIGFLQMGAQAAMEQQPGESDEEHAIRAKLAQQSIEQTVKAINDLDTLLVGLNIDRQSKTAYLDFTVTAVEGSETAKEMAEMGDMKTAFAGFARPDAAVTARATGTLSDSDVAQLKGMVNAVRASVVKELGNQGLDADQEKKAKKLIDDFFVLADQTIDAKKTDAGAALVLKPDALTLVAGSCVADGAKVEALAKEIVDIAKQEQPDVAKMVKLNAETHEGVNLHVATVPLPTDEPDAEKAAKLLGKQLEIVVGTAPKAVYMGVGRDAVKSLKDAITKSKAGADATVVPLEMSISLGAVLEFAAEMGDDPQASQMAGMVGKMLAGSAGKDHVRITSKAVPNGATARIELEEGVLAVLGGSIRLGMMMGAGGPPAVEF